jgi:ATP-dependent DNA helicase RecQ
MSQATPIDADTLLPRFGLSEFRPGQKDVISAVLAGEDCLCVMPTGGGKSLCYQLPALAFEGLTLVVSPLIALMKDQVDQLQKLELPVTFINSTLSLAEQYERLERMAAGQYRLVYVVPERFRSTRFLESVKQAGLSMLAVDEAHCISQWGHDFRPDYARLGHFRRMLGRPTTIALTATATDAVRRDIVEQLDLHEPRTFITGFARPNLHYQVETPHGERQKIERLLRLIDQSPGSTIIYAATRKKTEEVADIVGRETGRATAAYHAGLLPEPRRAAQEAFMEGRVEIVVATTAFGMGIDKRDVRLVVHYNLPGTLEAYYQEAGRAGRDGKPSRCVLLFNASDRFIQEYFIQNAYPEREHVAQVYDFLRDQPDEVIELTQQQIKEQLSISIGSEGVGTCEQLLEGAGVLERMLAEQNMAAVRIDSDLPTLVDLLPKQARVQRTVLQAVERLLGPRRQELVPFHLRDLLRTLDMDTESVAHALHELNHVRGFTYVPPFRGRAIRMLRREAEFDELEIDFAALESRRAAELEKLNRMVRFALSPRCRQQEILEYFGDRSSARCGHCDNCSQPGRTVSGASISDPAVLQPLRMVLSGVARAEQRFPVGKNLIAQMLCGSGSARLEKLHLNRLSTFGLLKHLTQQEVVALIDSLVAGGYLEQVELDARRPVLRLTPAGRELMLSKGDASFELPIPAHLLVRLRGGVANVPPEPARSEVEAADVDEYDVPDPVSEDTLPDSETLTTLRQWRKREATQAGLPAFRIFSNATLEELARSRPRSLVALQRVPGMGKVRCERYGDALLAILAGPSEVEPPADVPAERAAVESSGSDAETDRRPAFYWTWRVMCAEFSLDECAAIRGVDRPTVLRHLRQAQAEGYAVRSEWFDAES